MCRRWSLVLYIRTSDLTSLVPPQFNHWLQVRKVGTRLFYYYFIIINFFLLKCIVLRSRQSSTERNFWGFSKTGLRGNRYKYITRDHGQQTHVKLLLKASSFLAFLETGYKNSNLLKLILHWSLLFGGADAVGLWSTRLLKGRASSTVQYLSFMWNSK